MWISRARSLPSGLGSLVTPMKSVALICPKSRRTTVGKDASGASATVVVVPSALLIVIEVASIFAIVPRKIGDKIGAKIGGTAASSANVGVAISENAAP